MSKPTEHDLATARDVVNEGLRHRTEDGLVRVVARALAAEREKAEYVVRDANDWRNEVETYWQVQVAALTAQRDALVAAVRRLIEAFDACDGNRGRFSCVAAHDCRCPKARAASPDQWKGDWQCECGAEALDAALAAACAALARVEGETR
jgi:hypothetical protein